MKTVLYMPDGNRRFARKKGISFDKAYYLGGKSLKLFSEFFIIEKNFDILIFHAMSEYSHRRADPSLKAIYNSFVKNFEELIKEKFFEKNKISFIAIDHSGKLPKKIKKIIGQIQRSTKKYKNKKVICLLGYSLEKDINQALSKNPRNYSELKKELIFPEIDIVIRPIEMRVSGGPVYAMSQSQMITLNKLNPEVKRKDLEKVWKEYYRLKNYREKQKQK